MTLSFFILSERPITKGRRIDTDRFPNLGYIAETPDLSVTRILSVERLPEEGGQHRVLVELKEADRNALRELTAKNLGEKMVIMVGELPVMAPRINATMETREFLLSGQSKDDIEYVYSALSKLARP
jgi:hypothetical protein